MRKREAVAIQLLDGARNPSQSPLFPEFKAGIGKHVETDTDAEKWLLLSEDFAFENRER